MKEISDEEFIRRLVAENEMLRGERDRLQKRVLMAEGAAEMLDRMDDDGQAEITRLRAELELWRFPPELALAVYNSITLNNCDLLRKEVIGRLLQDIYDWFKKTERAAVEGEGDGDKTN